MCLVYTSFSAERKVTPQGELDRFGKLMKLQGDTDTSTSDGTAAEPGYTTSSSSAATAMQVDMMDEDPDAGTALSGWKRTRSLLPFLYLSLNLPNVPLFKETQDRTMIPQVSLFDLLQKFDGETEEVAD